MPVIPIVARSIEIEASPATVWQFFATQEGLRRWFESGIEIDMRVGGTYRFFETEAGAWISGHVLEIVPERRLVLSWFEDDSDWLHPIRLTFSLEEVPGGTRVTHQYDGFAGIGKPTWDRTQRAYDAGIDRHASLHRLKRLVESPDVS